MIANQAWKIVKFFQVALHTIQHSRHNHFDIHLKRILPKIPSEVSITNPSHEPQVQSVRRALFLIRKSLSLSKKFSISSKNIHSRIIRAISFLHLLEEFFCIEFIIFVMFSHINLFRVFVNQSEVSDLTDQSEGSKTVLSKHELIQRMTSGAVFTSKVF